MTYLEAIAGFGFLANDIENGVDEFSSLGVMSLGPVVSSPRLSKNKVVRSENGSIRPGPDRVHGARFQVQKDGSGHIFAT